MTKHLGNITFTGKSGQKYYFEAWPLETSFKPFGAVYFVTKRDFTNRNYHDLASHETVFIGHTQNLGSSVTTQSRLKELAKGGANCICVHPVADDEERVSAAQDLLEGSGLTQDL